MLIEEQIRKLQRIKAKIDLYKKVTANIQDELASVNQDAEHKALEAQFPGLFAEFCQEMNAFCAKRAEQLGSGGDSPPNQVTGPTAPVPQEEKPPAPLPVLPTVEDEPADPLRFLLKYKHLDGKTVTWVSKDGPVQGKVRGLLSPNVIVETDSGFTLPVQAKLLKVVS